jgi:hypothetical protein
MEDENAFQEQATTANQDSLVGLLQNANLLHLKSRKKLEKHFHGTDGTTALKHFCKLVGVEYIRKSEAMNAVWKLVSLLLIWNDVEDENNIQ